MKLKKRLISLLTTLALVLPVVPIAPASAATSGVVEPEDNYKYVTFDMASMIATRTDAINALNGKSFLTADSARAAGTSATYTQPDYLLSGEDSAGKQILNKTAFDNKMDDAGLIYSDGNRPFKVGTELDRYNTAMLLKGSTAGYDLFLDVPDGKYEEFALIMDTTYAITGSPMYYIEHYASGSANRGGATYKASNTVPTGIDYITFEANSTNAETNGLYIRPYVSGEEVKLDTVKQTMYLPVVTYDVKDKTAEITHFRIQNYNSSGHYVNIIGVTGKKYLEQFTVTASHDSHSTIKLGGTDFESGTYKEDSVMTFDIAADTGYELTVKVNDVETELSNGQLVIDLTEDTEISVTAEKVVVMPTGPVTKKVDGNTYVAFNLASLGTRDDAITALNGISFATAESILSDGLTPPAGYTAPDYLLTGDSSDDRRILNKTAFDNKRDAEGLIYDKDGRPYVIRTDLNANNTAMLLYGSTDGYDLFLDIPDGLYEEFYIAMDSTYAKSDTGSMYYI